MFPNIGIEINSSQTGHIRLVICAQPDSYAPSRFDLDFKINNQRPADTLSLAVRLHCQGMQLPHAAAILPVDQLLLRLAQDLFDQPADLALTHKFALVLRQSAREHPDYRLPQFIETLSEIARNQRRFIGFEDQDSGFEPPKGEVTVATLHRAKGLEWDRVYLMGVNNYNFPSGQPQDEYFSEKWFIRDGLNLEAETLSQLDALELGHDYYEGDATHDARLELVKERLRLFYVGLTRAKG